MDKHRGYEIYEKEGELFFSDTNEPVASTWEQRNCGHCDKSNTSEGHDACLGKLPGVVNACCGHGEPSESYVHFTNGVMIRGFTVSAEGEN